MLESDIREIVESVDLKPFEGKRVLITGGCGFLGRYFVEVLARAGAEICVVDNNRTSSSDGLKWASKSNPGGWMDRKSISYHDQDVSDADDFTFEGGGLKFDFCLHLAGIASPFHYQKYPLETLDVAVNGVRNVLDVARHSGARVLFFSSSEIYGDPTIVPTPESYNGNLSTLSARACYDESKRLGETICKVYHEEYKIPVSIVRPFNVYGPGMRQDDYRVLPQIASSIVNKKPFQIYGSGKQTRTFCYVTDAIGGFLTVLTKGRAGEAYNVGNPYPEIGVAELVKRVKRECEIDFLSEQIGTTLYPEKSYPPEYPGDEPQRRCPDIRKLEALGFEPQVTLGNGLKRFFGWALKEYQAA